MFEPFQDWNPHFFVTISIGEIENNFHKNTNFHLKKNPEQFDQKKIEAIHFWNGFNDKSAQTDCSKEMRVPVLKGLKHLNSVLELRNWNLTG